MMKLTESGMFWVNWGALTLTAVAAWVPFAFVQQVAYWLLWLVTAMYAISSLWLLRQDTPYKLPADWVMPRQRYVTLVLARALIMLVCGWHWLFAFTVVSCAIHRGRWCSKG